MKQSTQIMPVQFMHNRAQAIFQAVVHTHSWFWAAALSGVCGVGSEDGVGGCRWGACSKITITHLTNTRQFFKVVRICFCTVGTFVASFLISGQWSWYTYLYNHIMLGWRAGCRWESRDASEACEREPLGGCAKNSSIGLEITENAENKRIL